MLMTVPVEAESLEASGPVKTFTSSDWAERAFCEDCGSPLWYRLTNGHDDTMQMQLSAGLFDGAGGFDLKLEVFIDRKPEGYEFEGSRRQMTEAEGGLTITPAIRGSTSMIWFLAMVAGRSLAVVRGVASLSSTARSTKRLALGRSASR